MRFSIVIPAYNADKYFVECVESVLNQIYTDWEMIIVDDGSTDDTGRIADEYAVNDSRIRVVHKFNEGQFRARRDGILAAKGDYIICLDSDDYWELDCLSTLEDMIREHSPDIIMFPCRIVGENTKGERTVGVWSDKLEFPDKQSVYKEIISSHTLNSMVLKTFKRSLFLEKAISVDIFAGKGYGEDKVQTLPIFTQAESILYIPKVLYNYRHNSYSVSYSVDFIKAPEMVANEMYYLLYEYMQLWGLKDSRSVKAVVTYYLRNYIYVVYNFRKRCKTGYLKEQFKKYDWSSLCSKPAKRYILNNNLSYKEKIKLIIALYMPWVL